MNILIASNAPWAGTGYGTQTALLSSLLMEDGHDVAVAAFYGLHGGLLNWHGMNVYPCGYHPYGNDILERHAAHQFGGNPRNGLVLTLVDVWVLDPQILNRLFTACWTPVDHDPVPERVTEALASSGAWPIAMTRFGEQQLAAADLAPLYAPHGIDLDVFQPRDKEAARERLTVPQSAFVVGMVAANKGQPPRKGWPQAVAAFAALLETHDDAFLYLHTEPNGVIEGVNLPALLAAYKIPPDRVRFTDPYFSQHIGVPADFVADVYNAMDVLLHPAYGEGFGIPLVEAQACGTPVIATDWTTMPELVNDGWLVPGDKVFTPQHSFWKVPTVESLVWALGEAHTRAHRMGAAGIAFASQYDYRLVYANHWKPILAELEARMGSLPLPAADDLEAVAA